MNKMPRKLFLSAAAILSLSVCRAADSPLPPLRQPGFTPITGYVSCELIPVKMSDQKYYMMHELVLQNASQADIAITKVTLTDPLNGNRLIAEISGDDIPALLHFAKPQEAGAVLKANQGALLSLDTSFEKNAVPLAVDHNIYYRTLQPSILVPETGMETIARAAISPDKPIAVGPPLRGGNWLPMNVAHNYGHRNSFFPLNGRWYAPERWAIDYIRFTPEHALRTGPAEDLHSYPAYGQDLIAVSDGRVLRVVDGLDDLKIGGKLENMTLDNLGGNLVFLDIGNGYGAFYAHIIKGTVAVREGQTVRRGQFLGKLGNSGNSTGPHLHFHIVKGDDYLAAQGVPYVIDAFKVAGPVDTAQDLDKATSDNLPFRLSPEFVGMHTSEFPQDNTVIAFPE